QTPAPAAQPAPSPRLPTVWGFIDAQWSSVDAPAPRPDSSTAELRRARIGLRGKLHPNVGYAVLFDGADTSLKDAYLSLGDLRLVPGLELRFGQWKTPFGYEQSESDIKLLWVQSSYVVAALTRTTTTSTLGASGDARDLGAGVIGKWPAGPVAVELAASVVNGAGPNRRDDVDTKNVWGRTGLVAKTGPATVKVGGSFGHGKQLAATGANGKFDGLGTPADDTYAWFTTYGADVQVETPWFFLAAEWIQSERDLRAFTDATTVATSAYTAQGWYVGAYGRTRWNLGPIVRVEQYDRNESQPANTNERYTVGAYVDVIPVTARLVFNYEFDRSDTAVKTGDRAIVFGQVVF
ncbi:MAG TPA: porin, partial [Anaeromyxobacteraceae bacterium]|nr:porin [Anaeromyxobacteraceae bacterium]